MSPRLAAIEKVALRLSPRQREALAARLMRSVDEPRLTHVERAWVREAERRLRSARRHKFRGRSAPEGFQRIRREVEDSVSQ